MDKKQLQQFNKRLETRYNVPEIRKDISGIFASGMQTARAEEITIRSSLLKTSRVKVRLLVAPEAVADEPHLAVAFRRAAL